MRNLLFGLMALLMFVATSCEPSNNDTPKTQLELTSENKLRVDRNGGEFEIHYSLLNPVEGTTVEATVINSAMITRADTSVAGVVAITISENSSDAIREGAVIVSYGALSFTVKVEQD